MYHKFKFEIGDEICHTNMKSMSLTVKARYLNPDKDMKAVYHVLNYETLQDNMLAAEYVESSMILKE